MTSVMYSLEKVDDETARIVAGHQTVGYVYWPDSFWCLMSADLKTVVKAYTDLNDRSEMPDAYIRAIADMAASGNTQLDFFLDPPTFVGHSDGERACWIYTAHKLVSKGESPDFREWDDKQFRAAAAIYRRVVRKYGDSPPDKTDELRELMAR